MGDQNKPIPQGTAFRVDHVAKGFIPGMPALDVMQYDAAERVYRTTKNDFVQQDQRFVALKGLWNPATGESNVDGALQLGYSSQYEYYLPEEYLEEAGDLPDTLPPVYVPLVTKPEVSLDKFSEDELSEWSTEDRLIRLERIVNHLLER